MSRLGTSTKIAGGIGIGLTGCLLWFVLAFGLNLAMVLLVWNALGLHAVFGAGTLTFLQALAVAIVLGCLGI